MEWHVLGRVEDSEDQLRRVMQDVYPTKSNSHATAGKYNNSQVLEAMLTLDWLAADLEERGLCNIGIGAS